MATISPNPKFRAFDSNGDPLSGGLLYTYEAGTTTPKATYTTEAGDIANANPVVLDSDGYADVWLGDGGYKFVLKTSADVTIWTVDDLGGVSSTAFGASVNSISTNTSITTLYQNSVNICTSSPTLSLLATSTAGEGFYFNVKNNGVGTVTIDPDASETIDGASTLTIAAGDSALIICNGTSWYSLFHYPAVTEFSDSTFRIQDNSDATKEIAFEASGITTGTTRTLTVPDEDGEIALVANVATAAQGALADTAIQSVEWNYDSAVATTSGTNVVLTTSIPSTATEIEVILRNVACSAANTVISARLVDVGGEEATGYNSVFTPLGSAAQTLTTGIQLTDSGFDNGDTVSGVFKLALYDADTFDWEVSGILTRRVGVTATAIVGCTKATSQVLLGINLVVSTGAFAGGSAVVRWR